MSWSHKLIEAEEDRMIDNFSADLPLEQKELQINILFSERRHTCI